MTGYREILRFDVMFGRLCSIQPETAVPEEESGTGWRQTQPFPAFGKEKVFF